VRNTQVKNLWNSQGQLPHFRKQPGHRGHATVQESLVKNDYVAESKVAKGVQQVGKVSLALLLTRTGTSLQHTLHARPASLLALTEFIQQ